MMGFSNEVVHTLEKYVSREGCNLKVRVRLCELLFRRNITSCLRFFSSFLGFDTSNSAELCALRVRLELSGGRRVSGIRFLRRGIENFPGSFVLMKLLVRYCSRDVVLSVSAEALARGNLD